MGSTGQRNVLVEYLYWGTEGERLSGFGQGGSEFAFLFGTTRPFDAATLGRLYSRGRSDSLARFQDAADEALARGFLVEADAAEIRGLGAATPW